MPNHMGPLVSAIFRFINRHLVKFSAIGASVALVLGGVSIHRIEDEANARIKASCESGVALRKGVDRIAQRLIGLDAQDGHVADATRLVAEDIRSLARKPSPTCLEANK